MDRARPRAAAVVAWMLAATLLLDRVFRLSGLERVMLERVGPDRFTYWPSAVLALTSGLLWIALWTLLWPLVADTPGRRWMQAGLVCWLFAEVSGSVGSAVAVYLSSETLLGLVRWTYLLVPVATAGFAICWALAVRRCGLFPSWVSTVGFGWAALSALGLAFGGLTASLFAPGGDLLQGLGSLRGGASTALLIAMLVGIGLRLLPLSRAQATARV